MKYRLLAITILLAAIATHAFGAETATSLMNKAVSKLRATKSISATYTLASSTSAGITTGTMLMAGQKFKLTSPRLTIWYDGKTQWVLNNADKEVTISTPAAQELQTVNPFVIINLFSKQYTPALLKSPAKTKVLRLTAKNHDQEIKQAVLTLDSATLMPLAVTVTANNGGTFSIKLAGLKTGTQLSDTYFKFPARNYPGVEIIDLR